MRSAECGVKKIKPNLKCGVRNLECGIMISRNYIWNTELIELNRIEMQSAPAAGRECGVGNAECGV
jgi:hypothetical protein